MSRTRRRTTWQDLLDDADEQVPDRAPQSGPAPSPPDRRQPAPSVESVGSMVDELSTLPIQPGPSTPPGLRLEELDLPDEARLLLEEYQALEAKVRGIQQPDDDEDRSERDRLRFPVKVHTVESRIEDRRLARQDEATAAAVKGRLEQQAIDQKRAVEREAQRHELRLARLLANRELTEAEQRERDRRAQWLVSRTIERQQDERREEARRDAEAAALTRLHHRRRMEAEIEERGRDRERRRLQDQRSSTRLLNRTEDERLDRQREAAAERRRARREEEAALDRRSRREGDDG